MLDNFSFSEKYWIVSWMSVRPNNNTNGPDKKFILTAIVSGDNQEPENIDPILNQKAINECQRNGIEFAAPTLPRISQKLSAITFGIYIYA
jgi:hypothetical protein